MSSSLQFFSEYLDAKEIKYSVEDSNRLSVFLRGDNMSTIRTIFVFGNDGKDVAIRIFSVAKVPKDKLFKFYFVCSELNSKFRWVKFYVDDDGELTVAHDAVIDPYTIATECFELLMRICHIIDQAYPLLMKILWE